MKTHDSLGRRLRTLKQPSGERHYLQDRDVEWFHFLHKHGGMLPTSYLHEYTKKTHQGRVYSVRRLCTLHNDLNMIDRPHQQNETLDPRSNEIVHRLNDESISVLEWKDKYSKYAPATTGPFKHQLMVGSITASFELGARDTENIKYIPQHELLEAAGKILSIDSEFGALKPDAMFALEIDGKRIIFFLEADRSTEPTRSRDSRKSWEKNINQYRQLIGSKEYKEIFGVTCGAMLLVVTTSKAKRDGILEVISEQFPSGCNYMLVHHIPEFGFTFKPPVLMDMLGVEWQRSKNSTFTLRKTELRNS